MRDRWRAVASLLSREFALEVHPSHIWGAGYDPGHTTLLESWARGELEDLPEEMRRPKGVLFDPKDLFGEGESFAVSAVRHEICYLLWTHFPVWYSGQREVLRAGYPPTAFVLLLSVLESLRVDEQLVGLHPSSADSLRERYRRILSSLRAEYPHQRAALSLIRRWLGEERPQESLPEKLLQEYLRERDPQRSYDILMEDIWARFRVLVDRSVELNRIDLLLEEAKGGRRKGGGGGRIMTDLLRRLPQRVQRSLAEHKERSAVDLPQGLRKEVLRALSSLPDWMRGYMDQMSFMDMVERDLGLLRSFLPRCLGVDVEHRELLSFVFREWKGAGVVGGGRAVKTSVDRGYVREFGLTEEEFRTYRVVLRDVLPHVDHLRRMFSALLPEEEERWSGGYPRGRRMDLRRLSRELSTGGGRVYMRRDQPVRRELAFGLLVDLSSSMRKREKLESAIRALVLVCEALDRLGMPFSVGFFNDRVETLKGFQDDYRSLRAALLRLGEFARGGTDLGKAVAEGVESIELFTRRMGIRGVLVLFTDSVPTRGLKGSDLRDLVRRSKQRVAVVCVGVCSAAEKVREYFEDTAVSAEDLQELPRTLSSVLENQLRRLTSFGSGSG